MPKNIFNIKEVNNNDDLDELENEFLLKMMDALEICKNDDEKVNADLNIVNQKLAYENIEFKRNSNYIFPWKMFSTYGKELRGFETV